MTTIGPVRVVPPVAGARRDTDRGTFHTAKKKPGIRVHRTTYEVIFDPTEEQAVDTRTYIDVRTLSLTDVTAFIANISNGKDRDRVHAYYVGA